MIDDTFFDQNKVDGPGGGRTTDTTGGMISLSDAGEVVVGQVERARRCGMSRSPGRIGMRACSAPAARYSNVNVLSGRGAPSAPLF